jgi:hypothetical protein
VDDIKRWKWSKGRVTLLPPAKTASGAIVMAFGIFIEGVLKGFPVDYTRFSEYLTFMLIGLWIFFGACFLKSIADQAFKALHLADPIDTFSIGTWVAGTSICTILISHQFPDASVIVKGLAAFNSFLWIFFLYLCIRNFRALFISDQYKKIHGVIFLSAVSTQSLVIMFNNVFHIDKMAYLNMTLIGIGILFYFISVYFLVKKYKTFTQWNIADDWANTNCILHGSVSITGLASLVTQSVGYEVVLVLWVWAFLSFVFVEGIELWRMKVRIQKYGFLKGIFTYHITQWSRIFTFGMLYTFTLRFSLEHGSVPSFLGIIQKSRPK